MFEKSCIRRSCKICLSRRCGKFKIRKGRICTLKTEHEEIKISGMHRLRFTAVENSATCILAPADANVKPDERIELITKTDKPGAKASHKALRLLLDFPNHLAEPQTGAKLLGLVTLAQAASLYKVQAGTPLPSVQITGMLRFPESVGDLLRAIQGSEKWSGDGWHLHRPWVIRPLYRVELLAPRLASTATPEGN